VRGYSTISTPLTVLRRPVHMNRKTSAQGPHQRLTTLLSIFLSLFRSTRSSSSEGSSSGGGVLETGLWVPRSACSTYLDKVSCTEGCGRGALEGTSVANPERGVVPCEPVVAALCLGAIHSLPRRSLRDVGTALALAGRSPDDVLPPIDPMRFRSFSHSVSTRADIREKTAEDRLSTACTNFLPRERRDMWCGARQLNADSLRDECPIYAAGAARGAMPVVRTTEVRWSRPTSASQISPAGCRKQESMGFDALQAFLLHLIMPSPTDEAESSSRSVPWHRVHTTERRRQPR
jgi:hypothetical protein